MLGYYAINIDRPANIELSRILDQSQFAQQHSGSELPLGDRCTPARGPMDMQDAEGCHGTPEAEERPISCAVTHNTEFEIGSDCPNFANLDVLLSKSGLLKLIVN